MIDVNSDVNEKDFKVILHLCSAHLMHSIGIKWSIVIRNSYLITYYYCTVQEILYPDFRHSPVPKLGMPKNSLYFSFSLPI